MIENAHQKDSETKVDQTQNQATSTINQVQNVAQKPTNENENEVQDDSTKNMTKAEKKVFDLHEKLRLAQLELEKEKEQEKEKNSQEIFKLLDKKKLLNIPLQSWKDKIKQIVEILEK